jgi:DNA-binding LacI/PurR family transcriptional regulator
MAQRARRSDRILQALRTQLLDGTWVPGSRIPTRSALARRFAASSVTIQGVLDHLVADGFVSAHGRTGTFVVDHPPHLSHFGLIIPGTRDSRGRWPHYWRALEEEARRLFSSGPRTLSVYDGIAERDERSYGQLLRDVQARRLAGLIFPSNPFYLVNSPVLDLKGIPRVMVGDIDGDGVLAGRVELEFTTFFERALDRLAARGRRRIALLTVAGLDQASRERFRSGIAARGMESRPEWQQAAVINYPEWSANLTQLLFGSGQQSRPDGLVITDDNLVAPAMQGIIMAGVEVPTGLDVVAHANFPTPTPSPLPIARLGFDMRALLQLCIGSLERQRREGISATSSRLAPHFDHQPLPAAPSATGPAAGRAAGV